MRSTTLTALAILLLRLPLAAQLRIETGGGEARLDQMASSSLASLGGSFDAVLGATHLRFSGNGDQHIGLGVAGALAAGARYHLAASGWTVDVGPELEAAREIAASWAGTLAGDVSVVRDLGWLVVNGGWRQGIAQSGSQRASWRRPAFGAEFRVGKLQLGSSWQSTIVQDSTLRQNFLYDLPTIPDSAYQSRVRDIQDVAVKLGYTAGVLSFNARMGRRFGAGIVPEAWWEGSAVVHVTPVMSLTMKTGHLASDVLLGLRGGQYTTIGLRLDLLQQLARDGHPAGRHHHADLPLTEVVRESATMVHLYFVLPADVRRASLVSDLTSWRPLELHRSGEGRWEIALAATSGTYRVNISTDDGPWQAPAGLPATDDGFGSRVGLLVLDY